MTGPVLAIAGKGRIPLDKKTTVGRGEKCDVVIVDPEVSRTHCRIEIEGDEAWVEDLRSLNGTFVNGVRVLSRHPLRDGDEIALAGSKTTFLMNSNETQVIRFDTPPGGPTERA